MLIIVNLAAMLKVNGRYWLFQIVGWTLWCLTGMYINLVAYKENFVRKIDSLDGVYEVFINKYLLSLATTFVCGILITHVLRLVLKRLGWLSYSYNKLAYTFFIAAIIGGFAFYFVPDKVERLAKISIDDYFNELSLKKVQELEDKLGLSSIKYYEDKYIVSSTKDSVALAQIIQLQNNTGWKRNSKGEWEHKKANKTFNIYLAILFVGLWLLVYLVWHFVVRNRREQLTRLKLENTVKELELKTLKAHINPHFIFNSLNSIRALVDENPQRARTAITELSNLLRSSMQSEKILTTPLEKEMKIVEDYLALEKIRFEDRLQVELQIDEDTLDQQVPPMMVQTLVENAIKHGISKRVSGGKIEIHSDFVNSHYELSVKNTGKLDSVTSVDGFGLKSTQDRLKLLYGNEASFAIYQETDNTVTVKIVMPLRIN